MKGTRKVSGAAASILKGVATGVLTGIALFLVWKVVVRGNSAPVPRHVAPVKATGRTSATPVSQLRAWLMVHPGLAIPEMSLAGADTWASIGAAVDFESQSGIYDAVRKLRSAGRQAFGMR